MIALRLRKRRDGSLCLTDAASSVSSPDRAFPAEHGFTYEWLASNSEVAKSDGDTLTVTLANASAVYRVTERRADGLDVELVKSDLFDAPPLDEKKAAAIASTREAMEIAATDIANVGSVLVNEEG